jgi:hypothetical protein
MKKILYVLPLFLVLAFTYGFLKISQDPNADINPLSNSERYNGNNNAADTTPPAGFPFPTIINFNYATIANMNSGTVGAMYLFGKYYFNRWSAPAETYIWDSTGTNGGPGVMRTVPYVGANRDLTTDGRYIYGGNTLTTLYRLDTNMATLKTFTIAGAQFRAVAWDPGRKGFWNCGFSGNIICHDTTGVVKGTIVNAYDAKYGLAFDSLTATDTGFVWCWDQGPLSAGPNRLTKIAATTGTTLATYNFALVSAAIAGGAEICIYPGSVPPRKTLLLNYQNFALVAYKMGDVITSIENQQSMISDFRLSQNYPNPFNPSTKINFNLMKMNNVNLSVYDAAGKLVKTLVNQVMEAGDHTVTFDASNLATGIYYYTISAGDFKDTKKMVLVK